MIFALSFKTPDIMDQLHQDFRDPEQLDQAEQFAKQFLKFDEYVDIEFDTEKNTATVKRSQG